MSVEQGRVATLLLRETFGEIVERVGSYLIKHGAHSLHDITKGADMTKDQVKDQHALLHDYNLESVGNPSQGM